MTAPDDVRARFEAWSNAPNKPFAPLCEWYALDPVRGYGWACFHAGYRAAHADLSGEVRELVEAATEIADNTENWNRAVIKIIGRQPNTGIGTERLRAALAKFTQEKP